MKTALENPLKVTDEKQKTAGVVVGRFQAHQLHRGHRYLLDYVAERHDQLIVLVGVNPGWTNKRNPMDFATRVLMIQRAYPKAIVLPVTDHESDDTWSHQLDRAVKERLPEHAVTLYGSRDSFFHHYYGGFATKEVPEVPDVNATGIRETATRAPIDSEDFRTGVMYAAMRQNFPTSFQTVDMIIRHSIEKKVLVGRKPGMSKWQFPGGFVDPADISFELAAKREAKEEVGDIEIDDLEYLGSYRINDFRYRKSEHKIMTALFTGIYIYGGIVAGDDLEEVRWQDTETLMDCLLEGHKPLAEIFLKKFKDGEIKFA